jgi:hypothetical protein
MITSITKANLATLQATWRRLVFVIVFLIFAVGCSAKIDQTKFDSIHRAAKALQGSLANGVSYLQFNQLLQTFSTEVLITQDKVSSEKEKELLAKYMEALGILKDGAALWSEVNSAKEGCGGYGYIAVNTAMLGILTKYDISPSYCDEGGATVRKDGLVHEIFSLADTPMSAAAKLFRGE